MSDNPVKRFFSDFLLGAAGRVSVSDAEKIGAPQAAGLSREELSSLIRMQQEERLQEREDLRAPIERDKMRQDIASSKALEGDRVAKRKARESMVGLTKDPDFAMANANVQRRIKDDPLTALDANDPEVRFQLLQEELGVLKAAKKGPAPKPGSKGPKAGKDKVAGEKMIGVKHKESGQTGRMPESKFNPDLYERL